MGLFSIFFSGKSRKMERAKKQYIRILTDRKANMMLYNSRQFNSEELAGDWGRLMAEFHIVSSTLEEFGYSEEELGDFNRMTEITIQKYIENMERDLMTVK